MIKLIQSTPPRGLFIRYINPLEKVIKNINNLPADQADNNSTLFSKEIKTSPCRDLNYRKNEYQRHSGNHPDFTI